MIHAFALEPRLVASWGRREEFRFVHDKFGVGTPRVMLELPAFTKWKRQVYEAASELALLDQEMKRLEELFRLFGEHKCRRVDSVYDGLVTWLENAEREHDRRPFAAVLASANPRGHRGVMVGDQLDASDARWACARGATSSRTPEALASTLAEMLTNCRVLHLVDPYFGPDKSRYRRVIEALTAVMVRHATEPAIVHVHCAADARLAFFVDEAEKMAARLPLGARVEFRRWREREGGDQLHNRFVLTDLGGVALGAGLDAGREEGHTDDLLLLPRAQYQHRWSQYVEGNGAYELVDMPTTVHGARR